MSIFKSLLSKTNKIDEGLRVLEKDELDLVAKSKDAIIAEVKSIIEKDISKAINYNIKVTKLEYDSFGYFKMDSESIKFSPKLFRDVKIIISSSFTRVRDDKVIIVGCNLKTSFEILGGGNNGTALCYFELELDKETGKILKHTIDMEK